MKVDIQANWGIYKSKAAQVSVSGAAGSKESFAAKTDLDSITRGSTHLPDKHMLALKSSVQSYVSAPAGSERIEALRKLVHEGTYRIPTEDVVNSLLLD